MTSDHAAGPGPWDDVRLAACRVVAARAILDAGLAPGAGSAEDVLSEAGRDDRIRAALEGALAGARAVFDAVRGAAQALNGSQRPADRWVDNGDVLRGAAYVERVVWGALGPVEFPPAGPPDGPPEVCAFTTPEQASRALAYARKAAPAPAAASAAAMAPVIEALSGTPGGDGRVGGWVPRLAAAVFVSFVHRSAPPGGCSFEETTAARAVARALAGALAERDANPAGPSVRVALSGPQARAVWQVIGRARTARPWRVMDALAASWDDIERPRNRPATGGGAAAGRHGGKLTMGAGAAEWLRQALVRTADARRNPSSYLCVAKALGEAIERAKAAEGAPRPDGCEP